MNEMCYYEMTQFAGRYLDTKRQNKILDVGSKDVNGSYRMIFDRPNWEYVGLDIEEGLNVDIVSEKPYSYPIPDKTYDVLISGSCLEHVPNLTAICTEMRRVLKDDGIVCFQAPYEWPEHDNPVDCWRIFPYGMLFLLQFVMKLESPHIHKNSGFTIAVAGTPQR